MTIGVPKQQLFAASLLLVAAAVQCLGPKRLLKPHVADEHKLQSNMKEPKPIGYNYISQHQLIPTKNPQRQFNFNKENYGPYNSLLESEYFTKRANSKDVEPEEVTMHNEPVISSNRQNEDELIGQEESGIGNEEKLKPINDSIYHSGQEEETRDDNMSYSDNMSIADEHENSFDDSIVEFEVEPSEIDQDPFEDANEFGFDVDKIAENEEAQDLKDNISSHSGSSFSDEYNLSDSFFESHDAKPVFKIREEDLQPRFIVPRKRSPPGPRTQKAEEAFPQMNSQEAEGGFLNCFKLKQPKFKKALHTVTVTAERKDSRVPAAISGNRKLNHANEMI